MDTQLHFSHACFLASNHQQLTTVEPTFANEFAHQLGKDTVADCSVLLMRSPSEVIIKIIGKIYLAQQHLLNETLFSALKEKISVRIDLSELSYVDFENMQLIFSAQKEAQHQHIQFIVAPLSSYAKQTIKLSGLLYELYHHETLAE